MKGLGTMGLIASLLALAGCNDPKPEDTRHLENPPLKPPNCPNLPELKNVTLKDGSIADVRIVQFGSTKMYFPVDLIEANFIDGKRDPQGQLSSMYDLKKFAPDLYSGECPGVVHKLVEDGESLWPTLIINPEPLNTDRPMAKNLQFSSEIGALFITVHKEPETSRYQAMRGFFNDRFISNSNLDILLRSRDTKIGLWQRSKSLNEFLKWLETPPVRRDNEKIFALKVDG